MSRLNNKKQRPNRQVISLEISPKQSQSKGIDQVDNDARYFQDILTRLILATNGWDRELDKLLFPLQQQLRKSPDLPNLKDISEDLYRFLVQTGNNKSLRSEETGKLLLDFLNKVNLPQELKNRYDHIIGSGSIPRSNEEIAAALEACLPILNQALEKNETTPKPSNHTTSIPHKGGFFTSLFKGTENNTPSAAMDTGLQAKVREKLLRLLEDLCTPAELEDKVDDLKAILGSDFHMVDTPEVIAAISTLVHDIREVVNRERKGLEDFLEQLMKRLSLIDGAIEESSNSNRAIHECHQQLEEDIEEQACDIESQTRTATDLGQLKQLVQDRIDAIRSHMQAYHNKEQELTQKAEEKTAQLVQRLKELETETEELRQKVSSHSLQALTDTLTGIPNRYAYEERLNQEYGRWKRYRKSLSLMIVDIDNFKYINDKYGHRAGDKALRIIANQLQKMTRKTDLIARYGGDEFVLLLPETTAEGAMRIAEKLLDTIENCAFHFREKKVTITISCGISEFSKGDTPADAFERADQALYRSKHKGRNQSHCG